ncbi:MAG: hypothetical protein E7328_04035 [Clostridiales bacterium]|nr:hypothetical protein [Clostridiales bacterium]
MSRKSEEIVACPHCGMENRMEKWESINTVLNPDAKEKLLTGELFTIHCEGCKKEFALLYDFLYHDMEQKLMVFCMGNEEEDPFLLLKKRTGEDCPEGYEQRIVKDVRDLLEKVHLRTDGLDDRVMELVKHILCLQMGTEDTLRYLCKRSGAIHLYRSTEEGGSSFAVDEELYRDVLIRTAERLEAYTDHHRIDHRWAKEAIEKGILA